MNQVCPKCGRVVDSIEMKPVLLTFEEPMPIYENWCKVCRVGHPDLKVEQEEYMKGDKQICLMQVRISHKKDWQFMQEADVILFGNDVMDLAVIQTHLKAIAESFPVEFIRGRAEAKKKENVK